MLGLLMKKMLKAPSTQNGYFLSIFHPYSVNASVHISSGSHSREQTKWTEQTQPDNLDNLGANSSIVSTAMPAEGQNNVKELCFALEELCFASKFQWPIWTSSLGPNRPERVIASVKDAPSSCSPVFASETQVAIPASKEIEAQVAWPPHATQCSKRAVFERVQMLSALQSPVFFIPCAYFSRQGKFASH